MTTRDQTAPRSAGRSSHPPLTPAAIVAAARELVSRDGFDAFTMRSVAHELAVGAMTLYTYFRGRDELVAALLDELLGTVALEFDGAAAWQEQLRGLARAHRALLLRVPSAIPYFLAIPMTGPHAARFGEVVLAVLRQAGVADEAAVNSLFTLLALNYGFASFEARRRLPDAATEHGNERTRRVQVALALLPVQEFPLTVALAMPLAQCASTDAHYEFALDVMVAGMAEQLVRAVTIAGPEPAPAG